MQSLTTVADPVWNSSTASTVVWRGRGIGRSVPLCKLLHREGLDLDFFTWRCLQVAPKIKGHLMDKGNALVGYQPLGNIPNFFRMILSNPASTYDDADQLLDEIATFGELWWCRCSPDVGHTTAKCFVLVAKKWVCFQTNAAFREICQLSMKTTKQICYRIEAKCLMKLARTVSVK